MINETKNSGSPQALVFVSPQETVGAALAVMNENGVTQIPVMEEEKSVGSLREGSVLQKLVQNRDLLEAKVVDVMEKSFPVVDVDASFKELKSKLQKSPAVLVENFNRITGIITRSDVLDLPE